MLFEEIVELKSPPKVKNLLWRAVSGCLPTNMKLRSKHVHVLTLFPQCNQGPETIIHNLVNCTFVQACWLKAEMAGVGTADGSLVGCLQSVFVRMNKEEVELIAVLCWKVWKVRNEVVWWKKGRSVEEVVLLARISLDQWQKAQVRSYFTYVSFQVNSEG
ncbi:uncharacterized protein LOC133806889 [Humulus lupulus]|uniref:uncharacterized protein LOC133806889 n=1 Tax=Humulus lupulus TaxID=3486 RepID=UPI002B4095F9|nr:uncharacterized protein LOC133806889 [Humulus lupulus]